MKKCIFSLLFFVCFHLTASAAELPEYERRTAALVVYEAILTFTEQSDTNAEDKPSTTNGLLVALVEIDHPISKKLLIDLYDSSLDPAEGARHDILVSNLGETVIPILEMKQESETTCQDTLKKHPRLKCRDIEERNRQIAIIIQRIKEGRPFMFLQ